MFSESATVGGASVRKDGKARSVFGGATGRLPVGESLAVHGRLGLPSGRVSGSNVLPAGDKLTGSKTAVLCAFGAACRPKPNVALTLDFDSHGKLSNKVKASAVAVGLHFTL